MNNISAIQSKKLLTAFNNEKKNVTAEHNSQTSQNSEQLNNNSSAIT